MVQIMVAATALLMTLTVACDPSVRGEELPQHLSTPSSQPLKDERARIWPRSAQVEEGVEYLYETGHCGLTYDLDFDGSFWQAVDPNGDKEPPSFFINYDKGYITLVSDDEARYESSTGEVVKLRRIDGPIVIGGCA
jgi:hypothetical protein